MKQTSNNITWFNGHVLRRDRELLNGHRGLVIWFTGLSASGKSTIAHLTEKELYNRGFSTYSLDGDNVRHGLCADLGFSHRDRTENIRRIAEMVKLFVDAGLIVLTAFISPFRMDRVKIRSLFHGDEFIEVFVDCPVEVCTSRDRKGLYEKAQNGLIEDFTGISSPYEPPQNPEITISSDKEDPRRASKKVLNYIENLIHIPQNEKWKKRQGAL